MTDEPVHQPPRFLPYTAAQLGLDDSVLTAAWWASGFTSWQEVAAAVRLQPPTPEN